MRWVISVLLTLSGINTAMADPLNILALGDSTTAGTPYYRSAAEFPPGQGDETAPYTYWVATRQKKTRIHNYGVAGERTDQILRRLKASINKTDADLVVLLAGVNDIYQGVSAETAFANIAEMHSQISSMHKELILCSVLPYNGASSEAYERLNRLNLRIKSYAAEKNIIYCETHDALSHPENPDHLSGTEDGIHPDRQGYKTLGITVSSCIDRVLE